MSLTDPKQTADNEAFGEESDKPTSMSLLGGIAKGDDSVEDDLPLGLDAPIGGSRNLLGQTPIIIAAVAIIAAGSLYAMRLAQGDMTTDEAAQSTEAKMDGWLVKLESTQLISQNDPLNPANIKEILGDPSSTILGRAGIDITQHQVPINFVKKNPFVYVFEDSQNDTASGTPNLTQAAKARQEQLAELHRELSQCRVNSIMTSSKGKFAMIDNELYQVGSHLGSFVIEDMDDMTIILRHGQTKFTLSIDGQSGKSTRRRR